MINRTEFNSLPPFQQTKGVCVLASYAVAAYPFTRMPVKEYFKDYCSFFDISFDSSCDLTVFEVLVYNHFRSICDNPNPGYKIIEDLHCNAQGQSFAKAREHFSLGFVQDSQSEIDDIENELKSGEDVLLILFINTSRDNSVIPDGHSITIGYDEDGYFIYDVNVGQVKPILCKSLSLIGGLGNAFLVKRKDFT